MHLSCPQAFGRGYVRNRAGDQEKAKVGQSRDGSLGLTRLLA